MARIRTIKPEFWNDEDIGELSMAARLAFIASWSLCDDEGLLPWTPAYIRAQVFAYDDMNSENVEDVLRELQEKSLVVPYKDGKGKRYGWIVNFRKHQRIDKPQKPKHPLPSIQNPEIRRVYAERDGWCCSICGGEIDRAAENKFEVLSLDHSKPRASGGSDAPSNIRAAHFGCNSSKKDKEHSENDRGIVSEPSNTEGIKDQGGDQGKEHDIKSDTPDGDAEPAVVLLPTNKHNTEGEEYPVTQSQIDEWQEVYPAVNCLAETKQAKLWLKANPAKRKTYGGMAKFLNSWMARQQNKGGSSVGAPPPAPRPSHRNEMPRPDRPPRRES